MILGDMFGGGDLPEKQTAQLDPLTQKLIEEQYQDAITPVEQKYGRLDKAAEGGSFERDLGGSLGQKYSQNLAKNLDTMKIKARLGLRDDQIKSMQKASAALVAQQRAQNDAFARLLDNQRAREAARSAALSSILGFGGRVVGYNMAQESEKTTEKTKGKAGVSVQRGYGDGTNTFGAESLNDAGMNRSMQYREGIQGVGDFSNYA